MFLISLQKEQLESHEQQLNKLENTILEHKKGPIPSKGLALQNYKEKDSFLQYEVMNLYNKKPLTFAHYIHIF